MSFGIVDERAVFMDERTDSYFMLDPADEEHLHGLLKRSEPLSSNAELLDMLGVGQEPAEVTRADYPSSSRSLLEQERGCRPNLVHVIKVANLVRSTRSRLRTRPIERVLRECLAITEHALAEELGREQLLPHAHRFLTARSLVPLKRNCLIDSLSLLRWLATHRGGVALLFGVKLDPFAAHCWLQAGDLVINDRAEEVAAFTPVRVIRCSEATP